MLKAGNGKIVIEPKEVKKIGDVLVSESNTIAPRGVVVSVGPPSDTLILPPFCKAGDVIHYMGSCDVYVGTKKFHVCEYKDFLCLEHSAEEK